MCLKTCGHAHVQSSSSNGIFQNDFHGRTACFLSLPFVHRHSSSALKPPNATDPTGHAVMELPEVASLPLLVTIWLHAETNNCQDSQAVVKQPH